MGPTAPCCRRSVCAPLQASAGSEVAPQWLVPSCDTSDPMRGHGSQGAFGPWSEQAVLDYMLTTTGEIWAEADDSFTLELETLSAHHFRPTLNLQATAVGTLVDEEKSAVAAFDQRVRS